MSRRNTNIVLAIGCLGGFWWFLKQAGAQPKWLRWATWW